MKDDVRWAGRLEKIIGATAACREAVSVVKGLGASTMEPAKKD